MGQAKSSKMSKSTEKSGYAPQAQYGATAPPAQHGAPPVQYGAPPVYSVSGGPPPGADGGFQDLPPAYSTTPTNSLVGSAGLTFYFLKSGEVYSLYPNRESPAAAVPATVYGPTSCL